MTGQFLKMCVATLATVVAATATTVASASSGAEIIRRPVAISYSKGNPNTSFIVYVRLDRALPASKSGQPRGSILTLNGHYDSPRPRLVSSRGHCYAQEFTPVVPAPSLANAHVGSLILVGLLPVTTHRGARLERYSYHSARSDPDPYYGRRLGCFA